MKLVELFEDEEVWKTITRHPNYEVSDQGEIRHAKTKRVKTKELHLGSDKKVPYIRVQISSGGRNIHLRMNREVAFAFLGNPPHPGMEADHKNNDRSDNSVDNLQWVTPKVNQELKHARIKKKKEETASEPKRSIKDVVKKEDIK